MTKAQNKALAKQLERVTELKRLGERLHGSLVADAALLGSFREAYQVVNYMRDILDKIADQLPQEAREDPAVTIKRIKANQHDCNEHVECPRCYSQTCHGDCN